MSGEQAVLLLQLIGGFALLDDVRVAPVALVHVEDEAVLAARAHLLAPVPRVPWNRVVHLLVLHVSFLSANRLQVSRRALTRVNSNPPRARSPRSCSGAGIVRLCPPYEKEEPNALILTCNTTRNQWGDFFTGDDTLLRAPDRLFDRASIFMMKGPSHCGQECEVFTVEAVASVIKGAK